MGIVLDFGNTWRGGNPPAYTDRLPPLTLMS